MCRWNGCPEHNCLVEDIVDGDERLGKLDNRPEQAVMSVLWTRPLRVSVAEERAHETD
jgi:hypothetical protein